MLKLSTLAIASLAAALTACGGGESTETTTLGTSDTRRVALAASVDAPTGTLRLAFGPGNHDAKLIVGPAIGMVTAYGVPGVPEGFIYTGIRAIDWSSGAGDDRLVFEVVQAADFDLRVATGSGSSQIDVKWVVPAGAPAGLTPSVWLEPGAGMKKIQVQLESFAAQVDFDVAGVFGAGDAEFKGEMQFKQGSVDATGRWRVDFGAGFNKAEMMVDSEAQNLVLDLAPRYMTELSTKVLGDDPSSSARVSFRPVGVAGGGKIGFEMTSAAAQVQLDHDVRGGAGMDEVLLGLTTLAPATVRSTARADLGEGMDKLLLAYKGLPGTVTQVNGSLLTGGGDDEALLLLEGVGTDGLRLDCGAGIDKAIGFLTTVACELN